MAFMSLQNRLSSTSLTLLTLCPLHPMSFFTPWMCCSLICGFLAWLTTPQTSTGLLLPHQLSAWMVPLLQQASSYYTSWDSPLFYHIIIMKLKVPETVWLIHGHICAYLKNLLKLLGLLKIYMLDQQSLTFSTKMWQTQNLVEQWLGAQILKLSLLRLLAVLPAVWPGQVT